jgi:hypothetical protein
MALVAKAKGMYGETETLEFLTFVGFGSDAVSLHCYLRLLINNLVLICYVHNHD